MRFVAERRMSSDSLRRLCIRENYFTRGDCAEYEAMLSILYDNPKVTKSLYKEIAETIFEYSDVEKKKQEYGCSDEELMADILFKLYNDATVTLIFIYSEEED